MPHSFTRALMALPLLMSLSIVAVAQNYDPYSVNGNTAPDVVATASPTSDAVDPPERVGRLSLIQGSVSFHTADQSNWEYATMNYPVVSGNSFWTEPDARAEIREGSAAVRLDGGTEMDITELDNRMLRLTVGQGDVNLHVENMNDNVGYQVITPYSTVNILQPGTYRINAGSDNLPAEVAVLKGLAQVSNGASTINVSRGETASIIPNEPENFSVVETQATDFDNWSLARDNYEEPRQVAQYVSPEMTGYEELGAYGAWQNVPTYGNVWIPANVAADWAPYRYGHWAWIAPWGWNWIDDAPWGFAPFHYGRWAYFNNHWGWVPGRPIHHPVYAPALVAFVGGNGPNFAGGAHPIGWFPLAPGEPYHPPYHASRAYIASVNNFGSSSARDGFHIAVSATFANRQFATVVQSKNFASPHPAAIKMPVSQIASAPVNMAAAPTPSFIRKVGGPMPEHISQPPVTVREEAARPEAGHVEPAQMHPQNAVSNPPLSRAQTSSSTAPRLTPEVAHAPTASPVTTSPAHAPNLQPLPQVAPGPPIHIQAQSEPNPQRRVETSVPQTHVETPNVVTHSAATPAPPALHEVQVQRPEQKAQLMPTHEGWVRQPQAHTEPPKTEAPHEEPHAQPIQPHPEVHPEQHP